MSEQSKGIKVRSSYYSGCCGASYLYQTTSSFGVDLKDYTPTAPIVMAQYFKELISRLDKLIEQGKPVCYSVLDDDYVVIFTGKSGELKHEA